MAGRKRITKNTTTFQRTIERVAIAALAAVAMRGEGGSVALAAVTIFVLMVVGEELGRAWFLRGERVTLRELALRRYFGGGLSSSERASRHRRRRKPTTPGAGCDPAPADPVHEQPGEVPEQWWDCHANG